MGKNVENNVVYIDGLPYAVCLPDGGTQKTAEQSEFAQLIKGAGESKMHCEMASWCSNRFVGTLLNEEEGFYWDAAGMVVQYDGREENWGVERNNYHGYGTGFRPVLVPLDPETLKPDLKRFGTLPDGAVVPIGTLYMNESALKNPLDPMASPMPIMGDPSLGFYKGDVPVYEKDTSLRIGDTSKDPSEQILFVAVGGKLVSDRVLLGCVSYDDLKREFHLDKDVTREQVTGKKKETKMKDDEKVSLWMRLGVSVDVSREELETLQQEQDYDAAREMLVNLLCSGRCRIDGNTYFPEPDEDEPDIPWDFELPDMAFKAESAQPTLDSMIDEAKGVQAARENSVKVIDKNIER